MDVSNILKKSALYDYLSNIQITDYFAPCNKCIRVYILTVLFFL